MIPYDLIRAIEVDYGLVSIITPSYNCAKYISETIQSVINQTYQNWELLITDDCSTDGTVEIINKFCEKDKRIKLLRLNSNSGAAVARNNSIEYAKGKYIAFLDSDDLWLPDKLLHQLSFMEINKINVSHTSSLTCDEEGNIYGINPAYSKVSYNDICKCDKCGTTELIYNVKEIGKLKMPLLRKRQDWAFKISLLSKAEYSYGMYDTLSIYRIRQDSLSRNKMNLVKYNILVYRRMLNMGFIGAWLKFIFQFMPAYSLKKFRIKIANSSI